jgi:hypothetical protein
MEHRPMIAAFSGSAADRLIFAGMWMGGLLSLATALVGAIIVMTDAGHVVGQDVGMVLVILLFIGLVVSALLHLALLIASVIRGIQGDLRAMAWVYVYLAFTVTVYTTTAVLTLGA